MEVYPVFASLEHTHRATACAHKASFASSAANVRASQSNERDSGPLLETVSSAKRRAAKRTGGLSPGRVEGTRKTWVNFTSSSGAPAFSTAHLKISAPEWLPRAAAK